MRVGLLCRILFCIVVEAEQSVSYMFNQPRVSHQSYDWPLQGSRAEPHRWQLDLYTSHWIHHGVFDGWM